MREQTGRKLAWMLFALWAGLYVWSFASFFLTAPTGNGFVRGLNKVTAFYGWQIAAGVASLLVLWAKRFVGAPVARRVFWAPISLAGLLLIATLGIIAIANYGTPSPVTAGGTSPPRPVTAPAPDAR